MTKTTRPDIQTVWASEFGAKLFNLYTTEPTMQNRAPLLFSSRIKVVRAMIGAMLIAEQEFIERDADALSALAQARGLRERAKGQE